MASTHVHYHISQCYHCQPPPYKCGGGGRSEGGAVRYMDERTWLALSLAYTHGRRYG
jgi:hypothetical protein